MKTEARLVFLGWGLFGLTGVVRLVLLTRAAERPVDVYGLLGTMLAALVWAVLTPLAAWVVRTFPLEPGRRARGVAALVVGGPLLTVAHELLFQPLVVILLNRSVEPLVIWTSASRNLQAYFVRVLMVAWPFLALLHAMATARRLQAAALGTARLEAEVVEAKLAATRAQVDPAFLLGTLDALGPLILRDGRSAEEVIVRLGDLLRRAYAGEDAGGPSREEIVREIGRPSNVGLRPPASSLPGS